MIESESNSAPDEEPQRPEDPIEAAMTESLSPTDPAPTDPAPTGPAPADQSSSADKDHAVLPKKIGRFLIVRMLGQGGFGQVYLGFDNHLHRNVAIKIPRQDAVLDRNIETAVAEARALAGLDHPHIVPVYDVGKSPEYGYYIVSKLVEGVDLSVRMNQEPRLSFAQVADLVATIAEALHHAHKRGFVHRDIKPGNILIGRDETPLVVDFGIALHDRDVGRSSRFVGTPAYMSPEQAMGESHRVDGRSDVFSLGVVLYELLAGRRAFPSEREASLLEAVANARFKPPRQYDETIPKQLERIVLRAMAKRKSERYTTAHDMAADLLAFLRDYQSGGGSTVAKLSTGSDANLATAAEPQHRTVVANKAATPQQVATSTTRIIPKGLRSFDEHDCDFFLGLLPGPFSREGLPESVRFWKKRIESVEAQDTFAIGLIYGPSGCGKSSLVRAGLFPRLEKSVIPIYVEATGADTERRLHQRLLHRISGLPDGCDLIDAIAHLRTNSGGAKSLIVLDQFEQWLHARGTEGGQTLVRALRQCDGEHVQCIILVRDDFWMALTRFMHELDIRVSEGQNSRAVDLFPASHAQKVLLAYGQAFGDLPESYQDVSPEQQAFIEQAVASLSDDGKVVCVRLALFADMMKGRPWTAATLKRVGGAEGIGETFLEEAFSTSSAPPTHRFHERGARAMLAALLPSAGTDIKGHMQSRQQLMGVAGYDHRPHEFAELLGILDNDLRLITPTDPLTLEDDATGSRDGQYYQLTHDYLVPSIRAWLYRQQRKSLRGQAQLKLTEYERIWKSSRDRRYLPTLLDWLRIRLLSKPESWSSNAQRMMQVAGQRLLVRTSLVIICASLLLAALYWAHGYSRAREGLKRLVDADVSQVPEIVSELTPYNHWLMPMLQEAYEENPPELDSLLNQRTRLHLALALFPSDSSCAAFLHEQLLSSRPQAAKVIIQSLHRQAELDETLLWNQLMSSDNENSHLPTASALALCAPTDPQWEANGPRVAQALVQSDAVFLGGWLELLAPVRDSLVPPLRDIFRSDAAVASNPLAVDVLLEFASQQPELLATLLVEANDVQFRRLFSRATEDKAVATRVLREKVQALDDGLGDSVHARQWANAAIGLARMDLDDEVWPLLIDQPDNTQRSYFVHRYFDLGGSPKAVVDRLAVEQDVAVRRQLLLLLGDVPLEHLLEVAGAPIVQRVQDAFSNDPNAGVHSAAEWALRRWGRLPAVENDRETAGIIESEAGHDQSTPESAKGDEQFERQWYRNAEGITMVTLRPGSFEMGHPQRPHQRRIGRTYSIATTEITRAQFLRFEESAELPLPSGTNRFAPSEDCPRVDVPWYYAAAYCNWLSQRDGIEESQWCYVANSDGEFADGMRPADDFLSKAGYRLPTEAEWEYACRAGTSSTWFFGESEHFLPRFAWFQSNAGNRTNPVAQLRPNGFGLFDICGNAFEWCQNPAYQHPPDNGTEYPDTMEGDAVTDLEYRVLRGGGYLNPASETSSHNRYDKPPTTRQFDVTFRVAKTELGSIDP